MDINIAAAGRQGVAVVYVSDVTRELARAPFEIHRREYAVRFRINTQSQVSVEKLSRMPGGFRRINSRTRSSRVFKVVIV